MGKGKKAFIDRKNAVTFHLVHRSQHDPLVTDAEAPQRVLVEAGARQPHKQTSELDPVKRKEEQQKYGIQFDDDYDYLQHLKKPEQEVVWEYVENPNQAKKRIDEGRVTTAPKLNLPSSVFATEFEEDEGMLNKAVPQVGPRPDWDPDVVAALDDDFDFENEDNVLEDDFVIQAMGDGEDDEEDSYGSDDDDESQEFDSDDLMDDDDDFDENDDELMDRLGPLMRERRFGNEETKSQFTEYSMSSSVIRRNEQLTLLDDRFERFYATYDDPELGDLATEEIEGSWGQKHPYVLNCLKQFKKSDQILEYNKEWDQKRLEKYRNVVDGDNDPNEELEEVEVEDPKEKKWDCESILSTCSNIYNHPKLIDEPKRRSRNTSCSSSIPQGVQKIDIDPKTGMPLHVLHGDTNQLTAKALAKLDNSADQNGNSGPKSLCAKSVLSTLSVLSIRPKDETPEEKKERKRLLKEYRSERRIEKKANAEAFKEEKKRQTHVKLNQRLNQQGNTIL
ncbi:protein LTV1 homolog [Lucilia cuprina]|uniref:protein LTV1 homolog n=1 Tax=Lucilia cuprina TaxID=7375 RepID=UPI001F06FBC8|nr:protein LTV1 homolog [Lucilia cuprina]